MEVNENDRWREIRDLGRGGFGCVSLCQKGTSEEYIAIKRCHHRNFANDVSPKMMERWRTEVYIMGRLQHDNVIRAVDLPPELKPRSGEPPILAMEYCEGGDLRKVLNQPQNCCGLREPEIRSLVTGIGSAIEYLHSHRIIHRDLKPENIVLKINGDRILYKIIDLGYIKELDNSSICTSFVGTQQYLAPELNVHHPYTKTVDYWSFGTLVFECISGRRPFLPDALLVQWHEGVRMKSPDDISAHYEDKKVVFSKSLPKPNHLCRPIEGFFEEWLRLMLRWDPKARGGGVLKFQGKDRPKCFFLMEQIIALKIFHILYVEANTVLSFCVREEHTIKDIQLAIEKETDIPVSRQVIIQAKGQFLEESQPALYGCSDLLSEDILVFLFSQAPVRPDIKKGRKPPAPVQTILKEPDIYLVPKEQKKVWAIAVLWCCEQNKDYKQLVLSQRAALLCLLRCNSQITKQRTEMDKELQRLLACAEHFTNSLNLDLQLHSKRLESLNSSEHSAGLQIQERWLEMSKQVESMISVNAEVKRRDQMVEKITSEIVELQRSPFGKTKQPNALEILQEKAIHLYERLILALKEKSLEHQEMINIVKDCFREQETLFSTLYKHIKKVIVYLDELEPVYPELVQVTNQILSHRKQLDIMQRQRQEEIWNFINPSVSNEITLEASQMQPVTALIDTPFMQTAVSPSILPSMSNSNLESFRLVDDCTANNQRIQDLVDSMFQDHEESMSFLTDRNAKAET